MKRISGGIFKNRIRQARIAKNSSTDDVLDPTASDDELSGLTPVPRRVSDPEGKVTRWSIGADKNINEGDDDDEDIYKSDCEDETTDTQEMSDAALSTTKPSTPGNPKSVRSPKRKKVKKIDAAMSLPSPGKLKKKKKNACGATVASADSSKSKNKGKNGNKKKKAKAKSDAPAAFHSFSDTDKLGGSKTSKKRKS